MIPFRDENPRRNGWPIITVSLIAFNVLILLYEIVLGLQGGRALNAFIMQWSLIPRRLQVDPLGAPATLLSSMFMHAGVLHLLGNMLFLWIFGDNIEDTLAKMSYLLFYLASGLVASTAQIAIDPLSATPIVGASGAIAGVLGAYMVLFPRARIQTLVVTGGMAVPGNFGQIVYLPSQVVLGLWILFQSTGACAASGSGNVAFFAHIGGFATGALFMLAYGPLHDLPTVLTGAGRTQDQVDPGGKMEAEVRSKNADAKSR